MNQSVFHGSCQPRVLFTCSDEENISKTDPKVVDIFVVPTHLWNTPLNLLPTGYEGIPFIVGLGDCLGCALRVCCNFLGILLPSIKDSIVGFFTTKS